MDGGEYEKLSIRDSSSKLKRYGSTSRHYTKNEHYIKHYVQATDTLQGISLKYDVTIEQIKRSNKLWTSDSLFLKEFLLIPSQQPSIDGSCTTSMVANSNATNAQATSAQHNLKTSPPQLSVTSDSFDNDNIDDFLGKIDASIASTKEEVQKRQNQSEFIGGAVNNNDDVDKRMPAISRIKQHLTTGNNNNISSGGRGEKEVENRVGGASVVDDFYSQTVVVQKRGNRVRSSLRNNFGETQQDELFEL